MISTWLEYDTEASWGKLASALKEMGMHVAAKKIAGNVGRLAIEIDIMCSALFM